MDIVSVTYPEYMLNKQFYIQVWNSGKETQAGGNLGPVVQTFVVLI